MTDQELAELRRDRERLEAIIKHEWQLFTGGDPVFQIWGRDEDDRWNLAGSSSLSPRGAIDKAMEATRD